MEPIYPRLPRVPLRDRSRVVDFLAEDLCSVDLDRIADKLWWMSKQDSRSISPLHRQLVKRRTIIITEDPKLHLVWIHDRVFIKPLPRYITSHTFWQDYLCGDDKESHLGRVHRAALGFVRTYAHLIKHESDLRIAQDPGLCLVPPGITWEQFCNFASAFAEIRDRDVSPRYAFGEIRLTRLNLYAPLLLGRSHFQRVEYQYGPYFARFYGPLLFFIGITSVVLSAFQICVAVLQPEGGSFLLNLAFWFCVVVVVVFVLVFAILWWAWVWKIAKEWRFAIRDRLCLLEEGRVH
ncbi:hypothetical protein E0Z10_g3541 [Xylaria hypoxylon]|uniref:Subtilisin-like serine protease protein n=1 Tax=Xylaria hypoxylon TaxID=37992 RepID=A0A4Z0Z132_9PEZI|nr:hypothetical protein E0Z10_g3541 [Xylaria hypoxylon]